MRAQCMASDKTTRVTSYCSDIRIRLDDDRSGEAVASGRSFASNACCLESEASPRLRMQWSGNFFPHGNELRMDELGRVRSGIPTLSKNSQILGRTTIFFPLLPWYCTLCFACPACHSNQFHCPRGTLLIKVSSTFPVVARADSA
jgi:hypothetical protein